jgi:hypothetical protein
LIKRIEIIASIHFIEQEKYLLHPEASSLVQVEDDPDSTVFEVTSIATPEKIMKLLIQKLSIGLNKGNYSQPLCGKILAGFLPQRTRRRQGGERNCI